MYQFINCRCKNCDGKKIIKEKKILEVHIDKGMEDGHRITFSGDGDMEPGLDEAGDIIVVLDEKEHPTFKRLETENLLVQMELTLTEALCGFTKVITTLDERALVVSTIPGEVIKHGAVKCIMNEGFPRYKNPYEKGKLIVQFMVQFPDQINPKLIPKLEAVLPPKPVVEIPKDADVVEEVILEELDPRENESRGYGGRGGHGLPPGHPMAGFFGDDGQGPRGAAGGPQGVQCATQ